jgi:hypothetical protein
VPPDDVGLAVAGMRVVEPITIRSRPSPVTNRLTDNVPVGADVTQGPGEFRKLRADLPKKKT